MEDSKIVGQIFVSIRGWQASLDLSEKLQYFRTSSLYNTTVQNDSTHTKCSDRTCSNSK
jgi:hypothetical protein